MRIRCDLHALYDRIPSRVDFWIVGRMAPEEGPRVCAKHFSTPMMIRAYGLNQIGCPTKIRTAVIISIL
jgi:hypothetical protein